jgi:predicted flap endonuclease-1-like 5' DNA nuclease
MARMMRQFMLFIISMFTSIVVGWLLMDRIERQKQQQTLIMPPPDQIPVPIAHRTSAPANTTNSVQVESVQIESEQSTTPRKDDLTIIEGIGPAYARALNEIGIMTFADLAKQKPAALAQRMSARVTSDRIRQENWIGQAKQLSRPAD